MRGAAVEAVDAPEKLSLRGGFTLAARNRMHVRADSTTTFVCETAIFAGAGRKDAACSPLHPSTGRLATYKLLTFG